MNHKASTTNNNHNGGTNIDKQWEGEENVLETASRVHSDLKLEARREKWRA